LIPTGLQGLAQTTGCLTAAWSGKRDFPTVSSEGLPWIKNQDGLKVQKLTSELF
jgi:hypothetical protein